MPQIPSGVVTFLFTDIEGSTKLWERLPAATAAAVARHDALLRAAIEARRGYVFKTVGDAFCAAFADAGDALADALAAQEERAREAWEEGGAIRVRWPCTPGRRSSATPTTSGRRSTAPPPLPARGPPRQGARPQRRQRPFARAGRRP